MDRETKKTIKNVLIAVVSILLIISVGVMSYIGIVTLFGVETQEEVSSVDRRIIASNISLDRNVCNAIYSYDDKDFVIEDIILEFFNSESGKIDYVTIPGNAKMNIGKDLLEKLKGYGYDVSSSIPVRKFVSIFGEENAYQFGQLILEDALGIKISYYTVFKMNILAKYFVEGTKEFYVPSISLVKKHKYSVYELSESYKTKCDQVENDIPTLMELGYKDLKSNFTLANKLSYVSFYEESNIERIYTWHIIGTKKYNQFIVDKEKTGKLFEYILNNDKQYEETQEEYNEKLNVVNAMK